MQELPKPAWETNETKTQQIDIIVIVGKLSKNGARIPQAQQYNQDEASHMDLGWVNSTNLAF